MVGGGNVAGRLASSQMEAATRTAGNNRSYSTATVGNETPIPAAAAAGRSATSAVGRRIPKAYSAVTGPRIVSANARICSRVPVSITVSARSSVASRSSGASPPAAVTSRSDRSSAGNHSCQSSPNVVNAVSFVARLRRTWRASDAPRAVSPSPAANAAARSGDGDRRMRNTARPTSPGASPSARLRRAVASNCAPVVGRLTTRSVISPATSAVRARAPAGASTMQNSVSPQPTSAIP